MKTRLVVVAIVERDGKILMGNKVKDMGPYPNTWRLPGGGVEEGESLEDAVKREVREETGLEVTNLEKVALQEDDEPNKHNEMTHYTFHIFRAETTGEEKPSYEFPELMWVDKLKLKEVPLARPSMEYFKHIGLL